MPSRRQVDLPEHVQEAARGRAVGGEADGDAALDQLRELPVRKRAIRALHARARAVHGRRVGVLEQVHLKVGEPRHVRAEEPPVEDAELVKALDRSAVEQALVVGDVLPVDVRVRSEADAVTLSELHRALAQLVRTRGDLDRTGPGADPTVRRPVEGRDEGLGGLEVLSRDVVGAGQELRKRVLDICHRPRQHGSDPRGLDAADGRLLETLVGTAIEEAGRSTLQHLDCRKLGAKVVVVRVQAV